MDIEKIILGTVQLGLNYGINNRLGKPNESEALSILAEAEASGIKYLDTAAAYGNSEKLIGKFNKSTDTPFSVITKFHGTSENNVEEQITEALKRLNKNKIEGFLYHSFKDFKNSPKLLNKLTQEQRVNRIGKIGVSVYENFEVDELLKYPEVQIIQIPFNLLDNTSKRAEILKKAKKAGKIIHTRSVFLQGLFFSDINKLPKSLLPLRPYLERLKSVAIENKISLNEMAIAYSLSQSFIDGVLIGVDNKEQLKNNIKVISKGILAKNIIDDINNILVPEDLNYLLNPVNWNK